MYINIDVLIAIILDIITSPTQKDLSPTWMAALKSLTSSAVPCTFRPSTSSSSASCRRSSSSAASTSSAMEPTRPCGSSRRSKSASRGNI